MHPKQINCKEIFKTAYEKRYTWSNDFKGYKGKCSFLNNKNLYEGNFFLSKDFKPNIEKINDSNIEKSIASQLFEVTIHRVKREFNSVHKDNSFNFLNSSLRGIEMEVSGKNEGDKYRIKDNCINMVYRKIHGIIIEIFVEEFLDTGNGFLSKKYTSQQINSDTLEKSSPKIEYEDKFISISNKNIWLLHSRTIKNLDKSKGEDTQKFIFEDLSLL